MDVWELKPGERYFAHDDDALYHGPWIDFQTGKELVPYSRPTNEGVKCGAVREVVKSFGGEDEPMLSSDSHEYLDLGSSVAEEDVGLVLGAETNPPTDTADGSEKEANKDESPDSVDKELLAFDDNDAVDCFVDGLHDEGTNDTISTLPVLHLHGPTSEANEPAESQVDAALHQTILRHTEDNQASNTPSRDLHFVQSTTASTQAKWNCVLNNHEDTVLPRTSGSLEPDYCTASDISTTTTETTGPSRRRPSDHSDTSNRNWSMLHSRSWPTSMENACRKAFTTLKDTISMATNNSWTLSDRSCSVPQAIPFVSQCGYPTKLHTRPSKNKSPFRIYEDNGSAKDNLAARIVTSLMTQDDYPKENVGFASPDAEAAMENSPDVPPRSAQPVRRWPTLSDCEESVSSSQKSDDVTNSGRLVEDAYPLFSQRDLTSSLQERDHNELPDADPIGSDPDFLPSSDAGFDSEARISDANNDFGFNDENKQSGSNDRHDGSASLSDTTLRNVNNTTRVAKSHTLIAKASDPSLIIDTFNSAVRGRAEKCRQKFGVHYTDLPHHQGQGQGRSHGSNHDQSYANGGAPKCDDRLVENNAPITAGGLTTVAVGRSSLGPYSDDNTEVDTEMSDIMDTEDRHLQEAEFGAARTPNLT